MRTVADRPLPWRRDALGLAILVALVALVAWNRLDVDPWLARHDVLTLFLPLYTFLGDRLRAGDVPGWNPHLFGGQPFAADPQSGWGSLPAMLFFPVLSALSAFKAMVVFQLAAAAVSTYAFARVLGTGDVSGLVAAVVFAFGPFLHHDTYCCTVRVQLATFLPLALLGVELALGAGSWRGRVVPWLVAGFAISQMFAGWLGQGVLNGLLVVCSFLTYRALLSPPVAGRDLRARMIVGATTGAAVLGAGPLTRDDVAALTADRREVFRTPEVAVFENAAALPAAWIVHEVRAVPSGGALAPLAAGEIDPRRVALVEGAPPAVAAPPAGVVESAQVVRYEPDEIAIATETAAPGLLVLSEVFDRGWRATVDGDPAAIVPTNHALRGIPVPAGARPVEPRYDPASLRVGLWVSALATGATLLVLTGAGLSRLRRRAE